MTDRPGSGRVEFSVDWSTSQSASGDGFTREKIASNLEEMLYRTILMHGDGDLNLKDSAKGLCVVEGKCVWLVHVDVLILTHRGGNLFDAAALAVRAALANTKIPKVITNSKSKDGEEGDNGHIEDDDFEFDVSGDPEDVVAIDASGIPVLVTLTRVGGVYSGASENGKKGGCVEASHIVDATWRESACMTGEVMVSVNAEGRLCGVLNAAAALSSSSFSSSMQSGSKSSAGGLVVGAIHHSELIDMVQSGKKIGQAVIAKMDVLLNSEEKQRKACGGSFPQLSGFLSSSS